MVIRSYHPSSGGAMKIGIVGLEYAGKKTLFSILSNGGKNLLKRGSVEYAQCKVHDERIAELSNHYNPKKTTYAQLEFILTPSITSDRKGSAKTLDAIHAVDGIIIVLRDFRLEGLDPPSAEKDFASVYSEIIFSDLLKCESLMEKTEKSAKKAKEPQAEKEFALLEKCKTCLESEKPLKQAVLNEEELILVQSFDFLTRKPIFVLVNIDEADIGKEKKLNLSGIPAEPLSVKIESEIFNLPEAEQKEFLDALGLKEPGLKKVIHDCYRLTDCISFFTTGEDEVRAWTITNGTNARKAAGTVHSDMEKGFIRAEVVHYEDFMRAGNEKEAKKLNLYRLEGKEYLMKDGDIVNFRFNL
jgi:ribosome-binding ATPase